MSAELVSLRPFARMGVVTAAATDPDTFGPTGHHVRWFVSAAAGFPASGFTVRHVDDALWDARRRDIEEVADLTGATGWTSELNWAGRDRHHPVHASAVVLSTADADLEPTSSGLRVRRRGSGRHLLIHFTEPVIAVRLTFRGIGADRTTRGRDTRNRSTPRIDVRHGAAQIETVELTETVTIERPGITDLLIPNSVEAIASLRFVRELAAAELAHREGAQRAHLEIPAGAAAAFDLSLVEKGIRNRLFAGNSLNDLVSRYPATQVNELVTHLRSTIGRPDHTVAIPEAHGRAPAKVNVLDHIRLATLDPNLARMTATYWVDLEPKPGLYVIQGDHDDPAKTISLGFAFSRHAAEPPRIEAVVAEQLPGVEFRGSTPLGRAGLTVRRSTPPLSNTSTMAMLDVRRHRGGRTEWLTEKRIQLATADGDRVFTDRQLPVPGSYSWSVSPVDVFGRVGPPADTADLAMVDLERPIPPKHLVASVEQHGAPWLDPSRRRPEDRTGVIRATAELGEAQWVVAPDITELRWCWRPDPDGAADRSPSAWQVIHSSKVAPPDGQRIVLGGTARLTSYNLPVAHAAVRDSAPDAALRARLDPAVRAAEDALPPEQDLVEVLLNTALFEPDLFTGCRIEIGGTIVPILGSTAGVAHDDDTTSDRRLTARLFVPVMAATNAITGATVLSVTHHLGLDWSPGLEAESGDGELPPPLIAVPLAAGPLPDDRAEGGDLAIDLRFAPSTGSLPVPQSHDDAQGDSTPTTIVGRVVADHHGTAGPAASTTRTVLIRVRPDDANQLLQIERLGLEIEAVARHHRPLVMPKTTLGLDGAPGDIDVDLHPADRFATIWISAFTVDRGGMESAQVATPAEIRAVRPPPAVEMTPPYPEREGSDAENGQLSLPDVDGESTVAIAWATADAGTLAPHVRYELGRALASTIIATDRARWARGGDLDAQIPLGVVPGHAIDLELQHGYETLPNGLVRVVATVTTSAERAAVTALTSGRARVGTGPTARHHRLVAVAPVNTVDATAGATAAVEILMRPSVDATVLASDPSPSTCRLESSPDYSAVLGDDDRLRQLADVTGGGADDGNDQAFGLVTSIAVPARRFVDRAPGRGRSRFFYKVRAVFPGEARSAWSPSSVAFHQVDAVPAEPPSDLLISPASGTASFRLPDDPLVIGVGVTVESGDEHTEYRYEADNGDPASTLRPARITTRRGLLDLATVVGSAAFDDPGAAPVAGVYPATVDRSAPAPGANLLDDGSVPRSISLGTELDGVPLAIRLASTSSTEQWLEAIPGRYEIDLPAELGAANATADPPPPGAVRYRIRTLKRVDVAGTFIDVDSDEITIDAPRTIHALGG
ncbi:MAG: hypothetical protein AAF467_07320 [Actinomycetota bacterium]